MRTDEYIDDYEGKIDLEDAGHLDEVEEDDGFEAQYESIFSEDDQVDSDVEASYERDAVTGRKAKRPRMSILNKSQLSKSEMDELFLE